MMGLVWFGLVRVGVSGWRKGGRGQMHHERIAVITLLGVPLTASLALYVCLCVPLVRIYTPRLYLESPRLFVHILFLCFNEHPTGYFFLLVPFRRGRERLSFIMMDPGFGGALVSTYRGREGVGHQNWIHFVLSHLIYHLIFIFGGRGGAIQSRFLGQLGSWWCFQSYGGG